MIKDPVEDTLEYKQIEDELEKLLDEQLGKRSHYLGFCHAYWHTKKRILKEKYNIDWRSPAELNPHIRFD
ncbi:MAG: hypothetical protein J1G38_02095 [Clostridiales bacterium]|nr:hypothetical protein [Clostridiales bacterium]